MFVQVVQGKVNDPAGLRAQLDRWRSELGPGAKGYLGTTGGVAEDGTAIFLARFEDEASARANSERPEQGAWWEETSKLFEGDVTFRDSSDVQTTLAGGSDDAGFVQVMQTEVNDRAKLEAIEAKFMASVAQDRPDIIGSVRAWDGDHFVEAIYFTSEEAARKGEASMGENPPPEMAEMMALGPPPSFIDLRDPWLYSA